MSGIMKLIIKNGTVFNGERSLGKKDVEIQNGIITNIGEKLQGDTVIEAEGSFVSPGLTDAHIHMTGMSGGNLLMSTMTVPKQLLLLKSIKWAEKLLKAGFTSIRDCGEENSVYLRDAINQGYLKGPKILAAGKPLSQTFGHGEFSHTVPLEINRLMGFSEICDGKEGCIATTRKVLRSGADFIKIFSTGGVLSQKDSPEAEQFSPEEISAIVYEAEKVGSYVAAHAHGDRGIKTAVLSGVKSVEHGTLASEETIKLMASKGVSLTPTLCIQEFIRRHGREGGISEWGLAKTDEVRNGIEKVIPLALKHGVNLLAGTDLGFETGKEIDIGNNWKELEFLRDIGKMSNEEALRCATGNVSRVMPGLGRIEAGYRGNIVITDGDPLEDIREMSRVKMVLKDGILEYSKG